MEIRTATPTDVDAISRVARDSWEDDYPGVLSRETVDSGVEEWYSHQQIERAVEDPLALLPVAETEGEVVGFAHAILDGDEGVIMRLYVHPEHRRAGIGGSLFTETESRLRDHDITRMRAMVLAENDLGNEFYQRHGFEQVDSAQTTIGSERFTENSYERRLDS